MFRAMIPKHVELIGIINKLLLLHLVGVCIIYVVREVGNIFLHQFRSVPALRELIFVPYSKLFGSKTRISVIRHYTQFT